MPGDKREWLLLLLLAAAPLVAYAPAWHEGRLLAPGAGAALDLPLRVEVFRAWRSGEVPSWNGAIFSGTPLLASYRPGALHPLMLALAPLSPFTAFQALVLVSLGLTGPLAYLYARRLGAGAVGALTTALGFALGPYLVAHLGDTATIVAAPALPLLLLAFENTTCGSGAALGRLAGLAAASALVLLSGSWDAVRAAALLLGARLLLAFLPKLARGQPLDRARLLAVGAALVVGVLLAAPQLVPTLVALREAGSGEAGDAFAAASPLAGVAGFVGPLRLPLAGADLRARVGSAAAQRPGPARGRRGGGAGAAALRRARRSGRAGPAAAGVRPRARRARRPRALGPVAGAPRAERRPRAGARARRGAGGRGGAVDRDHGDRSARRRAAGARGAPGGGPDPALRARGIERLRLRPRLPAAARGLLPAPAARSPGLGERADARRAAAADADASGARPGDERARGRARALAQHRLAPGARARPRLGQLGELLRPPQRQWLRPARARGAARGSRRHAPRRHRDPRAARERPRAARAARRALGAGADGRARRSGRRGRARRAARRGARAPAPGLLRAADHARDRAPLLELPVRGGRDRGRARGRGVRRAARLRARDRASDPRRTRDGGMGLGPPRRAGARPPRAAEGARHLHDGAGRDRQSVSGPCCRSARAMRCARCASARCQARRPCGW